MSRLTTRLHPVGTPVVGLIVLAVLVVLIRAPSEAPQPMNASETSAEISAETAADGERTGSTAGVKLDSARQGLVGTVPDAPAERGEPSLANNGCFRPGSSREEVRALMGAPDTVDFGAWVYGESWVTFGYGVVLDYSNQGRNLRLC